MKIKLSKTYRLTYNTERGELNPIKNKNEFIYRLLNKSSKISEVDFVAFEPYIFFNIFSKLYKQNRIYFNYFSNNEKDIYNYIKNLFGFKTRDETKIDFIKFIYGSKKVNNYEKLKDTFQKDIIDFTTNIRKSISCFNNDKYIFNYFNLPVLIKEDLRDSILLNYYIQSSAACLVQIFIKKLLQNNFKVLYNIYDAILVDNSNNNITPENLRELFKFNGHLVPFRITNYIKEE